MAIDRRGNVAMPFAGEGVYRAHAAGEDGIVVEICRQQRQ